MVLEANTTALTAALADVNKASKGIASELRQVENSLKFNPKNTELLAQKQKLLGDQVATTREKLDRLKSVQEQINQQFAKGDIGEGQYRAFQREIVETESKLKHFDAQLKSSQGPAVFAQQMDQAGKKMQELGDKATQAGENLSMKVTLPILAAGAASFKMAADVEDAMGATDQVYGNASEAMKTWAGNLESYYGIAEGEALGYADMMGSMLQNIGGLTEDQAASQAQTLIKLAGDLTAMYGGTTNDAVRALTGSLKGNNSMLDNYGMAVNDATIKSKALEMGLIGEGQQLDLASKQAATLALIMEQSGAAQGQAAREADGASGSMRSSMTVLKNLAAAFGEVLLPAITPLITKLGEMAKWFSDLSPAAKESVVIIAGMAAALGPTLVITGKLSSAIGILIPLIGQMAAGQLTLNAAMKANVIGIVVTALTALIAVGVLVYKNWDQIKKVMLNAWDSIVYGVQQAVSYLKTLLLGYIKMWIDTINVVGKYIPGLNTALESAQKAVQGWIDAEKNAIQYRREERAEMKAQQDAEKESVKTAKAAAKEKEEQAKKTAAQIEAEKKLLEDRKKFEDDWTNKLFESTHSRIEILERDRNEQLALAKGLNADKAVINAYYDDQITKAQTEENQKRADFEKDWHDRLLSLNEQYSLSRTSNAKEESEEQLKILRDHRDKALAEAKAINASTIDIENTFALEEQKVLEKRTAGILQTVQKWIGFASDVSNSLQAISSQRYQNQEAELDNYYESEKERIEDSVLTEEEKEAQLAALDEEVQKRRKKLARDQAKQDKESAVFEAIINTAQAIAKTISQWGLPWGIPFAAIAAAMGAAQIKAIKAQPLPALAEGGLATKETLARIGEGKYKEAVLPLSPKVYDNMADSITDRMPQGAGGGGPAALNFNFYGPVIGDEAGFRKLAQKVFSYEYDVKRRLGQT